MEHKLMNNNITFKDRLSLINFLKKDNYLTSGYQVRKFEKIWSKWLGVKYSVFVNSGASANLLTISYLATKFKKGEIIVPTITWVSDITSVLYNNFKPVFVDVNLSNLGASIEEIKKKINKNTIAVFITHVLGFNALTKDLLTFLKKKGIMLIEDVCESYGAKFEKRLLGTFGEISNFSFYYAHHMTTIEGGMVSTNNKNIYEIIKMMRGHGMLRESSDKKIVKKFLKNYSDLNKDFIFAYPGYNFRSTEINAVLGINQIKRLNTNNKRRVGNFSYFIKNIDKKKYFSNFVMKDSCNYAFVIIFNKEYRNLKFRTKFERVLRKNKIEFRRGTAGGGNQLRQPYLKRITKVNALKIKDFQNADIVHFYGYYIGNYPSLKKEKILKICNILNKI
jgi:CDP-6-deoxy-D-xylo-4-hexulose-3-dehydrase